MPRWMKYVAVFGIAIVLLYASRSILSPFILAGATAYIVGPLVDATQGQMRLPRAVVIAAFYLLFIGLVAVLVALLQPEFSKQTRGENGLFNSGGTVSQAVLDRVTKNDQLVTLLRRANVDIVGYNDPTYPQKRDAVAKQLQDELNRATKPGQVAEVARTTFNFLLKLVIWFFATFYLLLNGRGARDFLMRFVPDERVPQVERMIDQIHIVLGKYLRGQLYLIIIMSVLSYIALRVLHVRYALPIALITGVLEIVPFVGPIIAGTIAALVALATHGVGTMIAIIVVYFVLREFEDQIVVPQVIGRVVHLDPVITIFAVLAGEHIGGIIGVLLAVPLAAAARVVLDELFPPKVGSDRPSRLTQVAAEGTDLPNDPDAPEAVQISVPLPRSD